MPVVGMIIKNIKAEREDKIEGGIKVDNQTNLRNVKEKELPAINQKGLAVEFEFTAKYESGKKNAAKITISGDVFYISEDQDKILKQWKKDKKMPDEVNIEIINAVLRKCLTKSISISEDLQLPPPIPLPFASKETPKETKETRYIG